ncbi:MAG: hypothetical protein WA584_03935 [Pyrinomonadaceae bacterium]
MKYYSGILLCVAALAVVYVFVNFKDGDHKNQLPVFAASLDELYTSSENTNPNVILQKTVQKYKNLLHYKSKGQTEFTTSVSGRVKQKYADLSMEYTSPAQMKLKWTENEQEKEFIINENKAFAINGNGVREDFDENSWGLSLSTGEYGNRKFLIAKGLFSVTSDMKSVIDILENPQIVREENLELQSCYVIEGDITQNLGKMSLWIDKENLLIRKIKQYFPLDEKNNSSFEIQETYFDIETK